MLGGALPGTAAGCAAVAVVVVVVSVAPGVPGVLLFVPAADDDVPGTPGVVDADDAVPGIGVVCVVPVFDPVEPVPLVDEPATRGATIPTAVAAASGLDVAEVIAAFLCVDPPLESVSPVEVVDVTDGLGATAAETTESLPFTTLNVPNAEPSAPKPA